MNEPFVRDDETLEDLQLNGLKLLQKKKGFRFGMDSVLLADFADIRNNEMVADFGTGSCILPLLLIGRNKGAFFHCFEIQDNIAEMAERTVSMNHLEKRIQIYHSEAENAAKLIRECSIDSVICNPPYGIPGAVLNSPYETRAVSKSQESGTLDGFFRSAFRILKGKGKISLIYPTAGMLHIMKQLQQNHLEPKRFQLIYPYEDKPSNLVMIEAVKDAKPSLHPMEPLIIYTSDRHLTNKLKSVYHIE